MITQRPYFFNPPIEVLSAKVHPKYIYGYKGWLFFLSGFFLLMGSYRLYNVFSIYGSTIQTYYKDELLFPILWLITGCLNSLLSICTSFVLYFRIQHSLFIAKVSIALLPVGGFLGHFFFGNYDDRLWMAFQNGFLANLFYALPAFIYLSVSRRVRNTYLFCGNRLSEKVLCPFCLTSVIPDESERRNKQLICPQCKEIISQINIAG